MKAIDATIADVKVLEPAVYSDDRGFFMETWNARTFSALGLDGTFVQDNHSFSRKGVLRGLHFQIQHAQGKLVRVVAGCVFDVAVDLRRHSATYRKWVAIELSAQNRRLMWIPPGFAHGFLSLTDDTEVIYKCTDFFAPEYEVTLLWNDPDLAIEWPLQNIGTPQLSKKDAAGRALIEIETFP